MSASAPSSYNLNKILIFWTEALSQQRDNSGIATMPVIFKHIILHKYISPRMEM